MPALSESVLWARLRAALPANTQFESAVNDVRPAIVKIPKFGRSRLYLWTLTADRSTGGARPAGEYKIQLILPQQPRGKRSGLVLDQGYTALLGYSPDFGVFVGWEPRLYTNFGYSANVQAREELLDEAQTYGWAVASPRRVQRGDEVRVAFTPGNLLNYLRASKLADDQDLRGRWREAHFLKRAPNTLRPESPFELAGLEKQINRFRERVSQTRLKRDWKFGTIVKEQYDFSCALCSVQLEIIHGAHIIPVNELGSCDEVWNGIAMCPNHHSLFDSRSFHITPQLMVKVDPDVVQFLRDDKSDGGIELLTDYDNKRIRRPEFHDDNVLMKRMRDALEMRTALSGLN